jgi:ferredoxin-NADP reductase
MTQRAASFEVEVVEVEAVALRVKQFCFVARSGEALPAFSAGSHILVTMLDGERTIRNAYSLIGSPRDTSQYRISVLHTNNSRGGSRFLHEQVSVGSILRISRPVNLFPMQTSARKHLLIAGGIGITPFLPMMEEMSSRGVPFEAHYSIRDEHRGAYVTELLRRYPEHLRCYRTSHEERMPLASILEHQPLGTHLYVCGPQSMIESVSLHARLAGWPDESIHAERFSSTAEGEIWLPFDVELARSQRIVHIRQEESLLEAIEATGVDAPYLCRGGACGQCETSVLGGEATLLHRDHYLSEEERGAGKKIMICVSRATGGTLILDL